MAIVSLNSKIKSQDIVSAQVQSGAKVEVLLAPGQAQTVRVAAVVRYPDPLEVCGMAVVAMTGNPIVTTSRAIEVAYLRVLGFGNIAEYNQWRESANRGATTLGMPPRPIRDAAAPQVA